MRPPNLLPPKVFKFPTHKVVRKSSKRPDADLLKEQLAFYRDQFHEKIEDYPELADLYWKVNDLRGEWFKALKRSN